MFKFHLAVTRYTHHLSHMGDMRPKGMSWLKDPNVNH